MPTKPTTPVPVESKAQFDNWMFLFYKWVITSGLTLDDLNGVVITSAALGDVLYFDGTNWVNRGQVSLGTAMAFAARH